MIYGSVCSGIEAATVAWEPLGWKAAWFSEIEPFPCAVLQHHYPDVPNLGDMYGIKVGTNVNKTDTLNIIIGGFPCQDLSVAGKRSGLIDEKGQATRSGLFFRIADLCDTIGQRWTLLENVPGLLSSKQGRDFAEVVGTLSGAEISVPPGGWENAGFALGPKGLVEWAILDAQYFGVPQRRRRVFIIRDSGNWQDRPPLLLERHSLSGYAPPSRKKGERVAPTVTGGPPFSRTGNERVETEAVIVAKCLTARGAGGQNLNAEHGTFIPSGHKVRRFTPRECERLQGFSDDYTNIPWRGKPHSPDGPRYKALGNSMAVPVVKWLGQRIDMVNKLL
ncbi:MAG: DNA cytosine methyltransferase [Deltaproteobacteria bacterium]|nr:DNA cytosine methyltransferase [Deltaproteobacteria bacterium]